MPTILQGIPFGLWLTFKHNFGLCGLWFGLTLALIYGSVWVVVMYIRTDWDQEVRKVQARLAAEQKYSIVSVQLV